MPYANMLPYLALGVPKGFTLVFNTPRQSVEDIIDGRVVAAPVPVAALPLIKDMVEFLGSYGISAENKVGSVLLFSNYPISKLGKGKKIYISAQSLTSASLLYIMLSEKLGAANMPGPAADKNSADAILLIGDDALTYSKNSPFPYTYDLASEWAREYNLPFVFARWVIRKDAKPETKARLIKWLDKLPDNEKSLINESVKNKPSSLNMTGPELRNYINGMKRILHRRENDAQELFLSKLNEIKDSQDFNKFININKFYCHPESPTASLGDKLREGSRCSSNGEILRPKGVAQNDTKGKYNICVKRLTESKALQLFHKEPLGSLMKMAYDLRMQKHPDNLVSFIIDTNPNYTNICVTRCNFCAFYRDKNSREAYTLTPKELAAKVKSAYDKGAMTVLFQGGHNPGIRLDGYISYIEEIKKSCPDIHIHPYSPTEISFVAKLEKISVQDVLIALKNAGVNTIPGGGAEILSENVRQRLAPRKESAQKWLDVMEEAHKLGFKTTATMMYGHLENANEIIEHLFRLRNLQDKTGGFSSFVPWSFKPGKSVLSKDVTHSAHPALYARIIALSRLVLDNFSHIQSSWFSETENAGSLGLLGGADDFGGILIEENVLKNTGYNKSTTVEKVKELIKSSGFTPALRNSNYQILKIYE